MKKRKVLLASDWKNQTVSGWLCSEKFDGMRAVWIPDARGVRDHEFSSEPGAICTGLFSSYGNIIYAPSMWLDALPLDVCLDGELYLGVRSLQATLSIARTKVPDSRWGKLCYKVFDVPFGPTRPYREIEAVLTDCANSIVSPVKQERIPLIKSVPWVEGRLADVVAAGGEGLILRATTLYWEPRRSKSILKVKKTDIDYGVVIGTNPGKGKYTGMVGSLYVEWTDKDGVVQRFNVSGLTDEERGRTDWVGKKVFFKHMATTTDAGKPREGRIVRTV